MATAGDFGKAVAQAVKGRAPLAMTAGAPPAPLFAVEIVAAGVIPAPIDVIGATLYGAITGSATLYASTDEGYNWSSMLMAPATPRRLLACDDGEVLLVTDSHIYRSTGWGGTPVWDAVLDANATAFFSAFNTDGDGTKFIAGEYSSAQRADSRYVHISTDGGLTWSTVWDTAEQYPATHAESHIHGACYDPWEDRFWFTEGHGAPIGWYYSDDNGATWTRLLYADYPALAATPTVLVATDDGIVCGTDDAPNGILGIRRTASPDDLTVTLSHQWTQARVGPYGFAERGFRDPRTGLVYVGFRTEYAEPAPAILAGTATGGAVVWQSSAAGAPNRVKELVVTPGGRLLASLFVDAGATEQRLTGRTSGAGAWRPDSGNLAGSSAANGTSMAAGLGASSGNYSVALGPGATAPANYQTAVGHAASAGNGGNSVVVGRSATADSAGQGTAVGSQASAVGASATAIGQGTTTAGSYGTAVGGGAAVTGSYGTAVGRTASAAGESTAIGAAAVASGLKATALGNGAQATTTRAIAVGEGAVSSHISTVVLGASGASTADNQVQMGQRHIEMKEIGTAPSAAPTDSGRLYLRDDGSGKTQLVIRFATGAVQVIATEP